MIARLLLAVVWLSLATTAGAQPVQLITEKEAKLPAAPQAASRAITRGPGVKLLSPERVANGAFPLKVVFEPRGGSKIDPGSVQVIGLLMEIVCSALRSSLAIFRLNALGAQDDSVEVATTK